MCRTPAVRTTVVPEAADGQSVDGSGSLQLPLLLLKKIRTELEKWKGGIRGLLLQTVDQRRQHRVEARRRNVQILRRQGPIALARWLRDRALWRSGLR